MKSIYARSDYLAENLSLYYLRTKDGIETDFAIVKNNEIEKIIEVKLSDDSVSKPLLYFHEKHGYPAIQLVKHLRHEYQSHGVQVLDVKKYLNDLFL